MSLTKADVGYPDIVGWLNHSLLPELDRQLGMYVNVKSYGAKGDGTTDDTTAIQAAINAVIAIGAGYVHFPYGIYRVTNTLVAGSDSVFSGVSLVGDNGLVGSTIRWDGSTSGIAVKLNRGRFQSISNLKFQNNVAKGTTVGVIATGPGTGTQTTQWTITNCTFDGFDVGFQAGEASGSHAASEGTFISCQFINNDVGTYLVDLNTLNHNFYNCTWDSNADYGLHAAQSNVGVFGGNAGRNGIDFKQGNAFTFTLIGLRSESKVIFDSQASHARIAATLINVQQNLPDDFTVTAATNATPIAITTSAAHGFSTGDRVFIKNVGGNTAANGPWTITSTGSTTFTLNGSVGNGTYTSGGTGIKDWNPIKVGSGTTCTLDGCFLLGSTYINAGGELGTSITIRNSTSPFIFPLDITDGNANLASYKFERWSRVNASNTAVTILTDQGVVSSTSLLSFYDTDGTLAANSDSLVATQKAVKTYVDSKSGAAIVATVALTGQTASIGSTNLVSSAPGTYRVSVYLLNTTPGTGGTLNCTVSGFDGVNTRNHLPAADISLQFSGFSSGDAVVRTTGPVSYATTVTGATGSPQYSLHIVLEKLQSV